MSGNPIRANLKIGIVFVAVFASLAIVGGLVVGGVAVLVRASQPGGMVAGPIMIAVGLLIGYFVSGTNVWVELDGDIIRERRLFTGDVIERAVADVSKVVPLVSGLGGAGATGALTNAVMDAALGTTNRGYLIRFRPGGEVGLVRGDVGGLDEFMAALKSRLGDRWAEVTAEPPTSPPNLNTNEENGSG